MALRRFKPRPQLMRADAEDLAEDREIARLRAIESALKAWHDMYSSQPAPRSYEAAWSLTLLDACLAGKGPTP